jgi:D-psicose/D-tagatose/L-ribulose 3-epimerase
LDVAQVILLPALNSYDFSVVKDRIKASGISCEVCNGGPLPSTIKVTGPNVDTVKIAEYIEPALKRAADLGAKVVICGIPDSRSVPEGFPPEKAWDQMVSFLKSLDKPAASNGITIAFEAINHRETNFLNLVAEGLKLVKEVNRENVKLVIDAYHLALEKENPNVILQAGDYVRHIHIASAGGRTFPKASDPDGYRVFFDNVKRINYRHRVSIEAYSSDLKKDGSESLALLRKLLA